MRERESFSLYTCPAHLFFFLSLSSLLLLLLLKAFPFVNYFLRITFYEKVFALPVASKKVIHFLSVQRNLFVSRIVDMGKNNNHAEV